MEGWVNPGQVLNPEPLAWRSTALPTELSWLGGALFPVFTNSDIIAGLVYEHKMIEPVVL